MTEEDITRIAEATVMIDEARENAIRQELPFGPAEVSPLGYEYYQLISSLEKMSPHDVFTLFMSP